MYFKVGHTSLPREAMGPRGGGGGGGGGGAIASRGGSVLEFLRENKAKSNFLGGSGPPIPAPPGSTHARSA